MVTITLSNKEGWREALSRQSGAICRGSKREHSEDGFLRLMSEFSETDTSLHGLGSPPHPKCQQTSFFSGAMKIKGPVVQRHTKDYPEASAENFHLWDEETEVKAGYMPV